MKILVSPHKCEILKTPVNEKEINVTKVEFEFSEEITDDYVKDVYFTLEDKSYQVTGIQGNECDIPYEVLKEKGQVEIGVVAYLLEDDEYVKRYNPSPVYVSTLVGSLKDKYENYEEVTPSDKEQMEQALQDGLNDIDDKLGEVDDKMLVVDGKIEDIDTAITQTNNLNIDVSDKVGKDVTVTLTKKDGTEKSVVISDGNSLEFMWRGTSLGIKTDTMQDYVFVDLQGTVGPQGPQGNPFQIKKTYATVQLMIADYDNMEINDYVMISGNIEQEDNAKLFVKTDVEDPTYRWQYLADFSGASGIVGPQGASVRSATISDNGELVLTVE